MLRRVGIASMRINPIYRRFITKTFYEMKKQLEKTAEKFATRMSNSV